MYLAICGFHDDTSIQCLNSVDKDSHLILKTSYAVLLERQKMTIISQYENFTTAEERYLTSLSMELSTSGDATLISSSSNICVLYEQNISHASALRVIVDATPLIKISKLWEPISRPIKISQIATGDSHVLCLSHQGVLFSTGSGDSGELGVGRRINWSDDLHQVHIHDNDPVCAIGAGSCISAAVCGTSKYVCTFGSGAYYRLGHGNDDDCLVPKLVQCLEGVGIQYPDGTSSGIAFIACGTWHMVAVAAGSGDVYSWGWNKYGQVMALDKTDATKFPRFKGKSSSCLGSTVVQLPRRLSELDRSDLVGDDGIVTAVSCGSRHTAVVVGKGRKVVVM